ncbi:methyltransferase domain-containing protein [Inquilinus limosus]|uniref:class I SAM-dependent methyltransferase n=1 Tax=Inquilinus limosus TaxID=171674 RepID=UPI003F172EAF
MTSEPSLPETSFRPASRAIDAGIFVERVAIEIRQARRRTHSAALVAASKASTQRGRSVFGIRFMRKPADGRAASGVSSESPLRSIGSALGRIPFVRWLRRSRIKKLRRQLKVLDQRMGLTERHLGSVTGQVADLGGRTTDVSIQIVDMGGQVADLGGQIADLDRRLSDRLAAASQTIQVGMAEQGGSLRELQRDLRETRETLDQALHDVIPALRREIMFLQRRLNDSGPAKRNADGAPSTAAQEAANYGPLDSLYVAFEDVFRGSREDIKARVAHYLERLTLAGAGQPDKPILDIGCGRGEWLEALKDRGLTAYGIDLNGMMVEVARSHGLDARRADLLEHLRGLEDASRSAVSAFHVVEHLPFEVLISFLDEALRVIVPGGILVLETPNPENIRVGASTFYNDPTHRNPIMPEPLRFIVEHRGFVEAEIVRLQPFPPHEHLQGEGEDQEKLNRLLFGPQDYAVIARRI